MFNVTISLLIVFEDDTIEFNFYVGDVYEFVDESVVDVNDRMCVNVVMLLYVGEISGKIRGSVIICVVDLVETTRKDESYVFMIFIEWLKSGGLLG